MTDTGIVASEGFPTAYKPNSKCTWYITVSPNNVNWLFASQCSVAVKTATEIQTCFSSSSSSAQVPEGHVVMLSFRLFDMEADPTCRYDYLDVYNGHTRLVQKLGRFCGTFRPGALISTSNTMMLEMVSDEATGGRGFLAAFSAGKPHMEGATPVQSKNTLARPENVFLCCLTRVNTGSFAQRSSSVEGG